MNVLCAYHIASHVHVCHTCTHVSCMYHIGSRVHECASCVHECVSRACRVASRVRDCVLRVCMNVWPVHVTLHHVCAPRVPERVRTRGARPWARPGLTLFALQARVAGLARTPAGGGVAAPVACAAVAGVAAVGSPAPTVTGCNTAQSPRASPVEPLGTTARPGYGASCQLPASRVLGGGLSGEGQRTGSPTSLAAEASPPRGTAATSGLRVAVPVVGTGAPREAAGPEPARGALCGAGGSAGGRAAGGAGAAALTVLAAAARVARAAPAGARLGLAVRAMLTRWADLLAAEPPAALGAN